MRFQDITKPELELAIQHFCTEQNVSPGAEKLLRYIISYENKFFEPATKVAKDLGVSRQTIYTYLNELKEKGAFGKDDNKSRSKTKK
jgi:DNA invertase Pin-like site-specific DNA recombinase